MIFRGEKLILPRKLQQRTVHIAHALGHLGKTKTKEVLRQKYYFPGMNMLINNIVDKCPHSQMTTIEHRKEPVKPTAIPSEAWHTIAMDFGGPFPDGHYNLVLIDKRTRYPVVPSTAAQPTREALKRIFGQLGIPKRREVHEELKQNRTNCTHAIKRQVQAKGSCAGHATGIPGLSTPSNRHNTI